MAIIINVIETIAVIVNNTRVLQHGQRIGPARTRSIVATAIDHIKLDRTAGRHQQGIFRLDYRGCVIAVDHEDIIQFHTADFKDKFNVVIIFS